MFTLIGAGCVRTNQETISPEPADTPAAQIGMPVPGSDVEETVVVDEADNTAPSEQKTEERTAAPVVITTTAANFSFSPAEIRVKKGQTVTIRLKSAEGFHDIVLDEFGVKSVRVGAGAETSVTFVANKAGTFEYYCSIGSHRQMGMVGKLIVN